MPTGGNATIYSKFPTNVISDIYNDAELSYNGNWSSGGEQVDGFAAANGTTNPGRGGWDYIFRPNGKFNYNSPNAWSREPDYFANSKMPATSFQLDWIPRRELDDWKVIVTVQLHIAFNDGGIKYRSNEQARISNNKIRLVLSPIFQGGAVGAHYQPPASVGHVAHHLTSDANFIRKTGSSLIPNASMGGYGGAGLKGVFQHKWYLNLNNFLGGKQNLEGVRIIPMVASNWYLTGNEEEGYSSARLVLQAGGVSDMRETDWGQANYHYTPTGKWGGVCDSFIRCEPCPKNVVVIDSVLP